MKKNIICKALCSIIIPVGIVPFVSITSSCHEDDQSAAKNIDGTDWQGRVRGSFAEGDYEIDEENETITYTCGIAIQAVNLKVPDYVGWNGKKLKVLLGEQCFANCTDLEGYVELNSFIDTIPDYCFLQCARLNGILFHVYPKSIGKMAFFECELFERIAIKSYSSIDLNWAIELESVGDYAFFKCMLSGDLIFGTNLKRLGAYAFSECFKINSVNLYFCNDIEVIPTGLFTGCSSIDVVRIPPNLTEIERFAFKDCTNLQHVIIPKDNMTIKLGDYAFRHCPLLLDFSKPFNIPSMGVGAFSFDKSLLSNLWTGEFGTKTITKQAFSSCSIASIVFDPNSVIDVEDFAFSSCDNLTVIDFSQYDPNTPPDWSGSHIFYDNHSHGTVYLPSGSLISQKWKEFLLNNDIGDSWNIKQKDPTIQYIIEPEDKDVNATPIMLHQYTAVFENFKFGISPGSEIDINNVKVKYDIGEIETHFNFLFSWRKGQDETSYDLVIIFNCLDPTVPVDVLSGQMTFYYNEMKIPSLGSYFYIHI